MKTINVKIIIYGGLFLIVGSLFCAVDFERIILANDVYLQEMTHLTQSQLQPIIDFLDGQEAGCTWVQEYPIVANLIQTMKLEVGCEIGVAYGLQSQFILENTDVKKLYSIDSYMHREGYDDFMNFPQAYFEVLYYKVSKRLARFGMRSEVVRKKSVDAAILFEDGSLDFVYIDAEHSYKAVVDDLNVWYDKVRSGGLMIGDDYPLFQGVVRAVNEFVKRNNLDLFNQGNKWWFIKP